MNGLLAGWQRSQAAPPELQLRDIHLPPEPSWWPPAPGWWLLALIVLIALVMLTRLALRLLRERARVANLRAEFDRAAAHDDPRERLAGISDLLRRAARNADPHAAQLQGEAWLRFLDGRHGKKSKVVARETKDFSAGPGRFLLDGHYRAQVDANKAAAVVEPARRRFLELIASNS